MTPDVSPAHDVAIHEVVLLLETDAASGLSTSAVADRLRRYGENTLPPTNGDSLASRWLRQVRHPLVYVLLVAAFVALLLGDVVDASVILGVVLVNAVIGFVQESKAQAALDSLATMLHTAATVRRNGQVLRVPSEQLVPGDLVHLEAGDRVPADLRLLHESDLCVDESALTGESLPVPKDEIVLPSATPVSDRRNMAYSGTLVTRGTGWGIVVATGAETELGEIHRLVGGAQPLATPLTRKLAEFSRVLTIAIVALAAVTFVVGLLRGEAASDMFTAAVALAVGAIPEGLPAAVTVSLAIGVGRMARRRAVVRRLPAVETLGGTTVVCSDKTGTLTENQMTVRSVWTAGGLYEVSGRGYGPEGAFSRDGCATTVADDEALRWTLRAAVACNDARLSEDHGRWHVLGDPTEGALLAAARKLGIERDVVSRELPRLSTVPFTSELGMMATPCHDAGDRAALVVCAKGALEQVLPRCHQQLGPDGVAVPVDAVAVRRAAEALAGRGLRVLVVAIGEAVDVAEFERAGFDRALILVGIEAMQDPPREGAAAAVAALQRAGIEVKMITGDHPVTAAAVGRELGILDDDSAGVLTGAELAALAAEDLTGAVERSRVLARVSPEQKLRLVQGLQAGGHVVGMTGDGVNDAPALRQADIGIAMGRGGTEVAKDAADMVLADDDFATIEAAVEEGRGVFENLKKFIVWTLPTNMAEGLVIVAAVFVGSSLPITPVQILWINMTTAVALGLTLAFEPGEPGIMRRPPRDPRRPLLTRALVVRIVLVSVMLVGGAWWLFEWELGNGASLAEARTVAVNMFVAVEVVYLFACRSLTGSVRALGWLSNRWLLLGVLVQVLAQAAFTYLPGMQEAFGAAAIGWGAWARIAVLGTVAGVVVAIDKKVRSPQF